MAKDPVKVDSKHYKVEVENKHVRVLRIRYGSREKSVMHGHPAAVAVFLTDTHGRFSFPDGKSEEFSTKAGDVMWMPACEHLPESLSDKPFEVIAVEVKAGRPKAKPAKSKRAKKR